VSILDKFTVTPLLYACGALLIAVVALTGRGCVLTAQRDTAIAQKDAEHSAREAMTVSRDAWKLRANDNAGKVKTANDSVTKLEGLLKDEQDAGKRRAEASEQAIAAARAKERDADTTLRKFTAQFQTESRKPTCQRALEALDTACPALKGY
jgi:outer membrane PBP1 activator LpoA protein